MAFSVRRRAIVVAFLGSLACKIENPNCDAYHLRVSIFAVKMVQVCLNLVGDVTGTRCQCMLAANCHQPSAISHQPPASSQRTQLVLGLATRQSQSLEIVEAMAAVAP